MKQTDTLKLVLDSFSHAKEERQIYVEKWDKLYDMYRFKLKKPVPGRANLYVPYAFSNVETVFPRMVAKRPRVQVKPRGPQDIEKAEVMKSLIDYAWETLKLDNVVRRMVKGMLIYGTGVVKITWKKEIKTVKTLEPILDPMGNMIGEKEVSKRAVTYDAPVVTNKDLRQVYPDPDGATVDSCRYIVDRYPATRTELESNPNHSKKELKNVTYGYTNDEIKRGLHNTSGAGSMSQNEAEVLEYWEDDRLIVVAGGVVLRDEPNPYDCKKKPFVFVQDQIDDQVIYGIGEVEPVETLQHEMNTIRNQRMDYNNLILNPVFNIKAGAVQDINSIKFIPGWKNIVQGDNGVTPMQMPSVPQSGYKEEESIKMDLQTVTGVSDYARGSEAASMNDTATGISLIQEAANQRFNAKLQNLEMGLQEIAEFLRDLYIQFAPDEMIVRITEKDGFSFKTVTPEEIQGEFDIMIESGSTMPSNKIQERTEEMNKYNVIMANPLVQQSATALMEVLRGLLTKWEDPSAESILAALGEKVSEIEEVKQIEKENAMALMEEEEDQMMGGAPDEIGIGAMKAAGPMENPEAEAAMMELAARLKGGEEDGPITG